MPYDKSKSQQVSIRIPHDLWRAIESYYMERGEKRLSKNDMIVTILDKWILAQISQRGDSAEDPEENTPPSRRNRLL